MSQAQQAQHRIGLIEKVEFTSGGAGNQWTTIDGVRYATWWDFRQFPDRVLGSTVKYRTYRRKLFDNWVENVDCVQIIRVLSAGEAAKSTDHKETATGVAVGA